MKETVLMAERQEIASFAPFARVGEVDNTIVMDIPVQSTDRTTTFQFRAVWDETEDGEVESVRVYAWVPNFSEISQALTRCGVREEQIEEIFRRDAAGNHMLETYGARSGGLAVAFANAYLTLVGRLAEEGKIEQLIENRDSWINLLPVFGVNSCGYRIERGMAGNG